MTNSKQNGKRGETWKPVIGYEGYYEVSDKGRVRSVPRVSSHGRHYKGKMLKLYINRRNGYVYVCLSKQNKQKQKRVHIAVMEAFTDYRSHGFNAEAVIDHLDGDKQNNCIENLEIVTQRENDRRQRERKEQRYNGCEVIDTDTGQVFKSYTEAAKSIGGGQGEMVARVCRGERSHYKNHHFAKYDDYKNDTIPQFRGRYTKKASVSLWR